MKEPLVSILIPVYNREKYIAQTIESALNQTYKNIEVIIVDNKSTDNTWSILQDYAKKDRRIKVYQNNKNIGPVRNWKRCIDYATGKYGKILWSDDLIAPEFIEKTLPFLEKNEDVGFVFTGTEIFYEDTGKRKEVYFIGKTGIYPTKNYIEGVLIGSNFPVSPGCALFRLKDLKKNLLLNIPNKINTDFSMHAIGNDLLIYLLTAKDYPKFAFVNEKLSFFRGHEGSISMKSRNELELFYNVAKAFFVEHYVDSSTLRKKFNAKLLIHILKNRNNNLKISRLSDFYLENGVSFVDMNYFFLFKIILKKLLSKVFLSSSK